MKRIAATTLALALAAISGSALAGQYDDGYDDGRNDRYGYGQENQYENDSGYDVAEVISVDPIVESGRNGQRQECWNQPQRGAYYQGGQYRQDGQYQDERYYRNDRRYRSSGPSGGTVLGAVIGGALGNLAGRGDGRHAATIAGAVIGGAIGHSVDHDHGYGVRSGAQAGYGNGYYGGNVRQCRTASDYDHDERVIGYSVGFEYNGQVYHTTSSHHPGSTIRVRVDVTAEDGRVAGY